MRAVFSFATLKEHAMPMPESDAKYIFCPLLTTGDGKMKMCQVAMCMMWRWADENREKGYCGMAGKPIGCK